MYKGKMNVGQLKIKQTGKELQKNILEALNLNKNGTFLKKAVRHKLSNVNNLQILGEEHAAEFMEGAQIDLIAEFNSNYFRYVFPIECKKTFKKHWVFFEYPSKEYTWAFSFGKTGNARLVEERIGIKVCIEGVEIKDSEASLDPIYQLGFQVSKNYSAFLVQEVDNRSKMESTYPKKPFLCLPLVITNTPLLTCDVDPKNIDIEAGTYKSELNLNHEKWLFYRYPFVPKEGSTEHYEKISVNAPIYLAPEVRCKVFKTDILILNTIYIKEFFEELNKQDTETFKKAPQFVTDLGHHDTDQ